MKSVHSLARWRGIGDKQMGRKKERGGCESIGYLEEMWKRKMEEMERSGRVEKEI